MTLHNNWKKALRKKGSGLYQKIHTAFEAGFEGTWAECAKEFLGVVNDRTQKRWYGIANQLKKYYYKRGINFEPVPKRLPSIKGKKSKYDAHSLKVYKIVTKLDDRAEVIGTNLDRVQRVNVTNFRAAETAKDNSPEILNHVGDQLADVLETTSKFVRNMFGKQQTKQVKGHKNGNN